MFLSVAGKSIDLSPNKELGELHITHTHHLFSYGGYKPPSMVFHADRVKVTSAEDALLIASYLLTSEGCTVAANVFAAEICINLQRTLLTPRQLLLSPGLLRESA